jgi:hypothetical protein
MARILHPKTQLSRDTFISVDKVLKKNKVPYTDTQRLICRVFAALVERREKLSLEIDEAVLENSCREMIETILFCLPNAYKGTIYRIGKPPELIAERITSGVFDTERKKISWGLPDRSEYNRPGKPWLEYRDQPEGRPLEAMAWCVERQKSWTSEDPKNDIRSVRLQLYGDLEDYHHMEPVLVHKSDLNLDMCSSGEYPKTYEGDMIWQESDYVVVAVVKIHFRPHTITIGSPETVVIKKLSRSLGTQLLSYQLRQESVQVMQQLARDRLNACNILADSLRNVITKSGLILSLIKQETGYLRDQWEELLFQELKQGHSKKAAINELDEILRTMCKGNDEPGQDLMRVQGRFLELPLTPDKAENWVNLQIEEGWKALLKKCPHDEEKEKRVWRIIDELKKCLHLGKDPEIVAKYNKMPEELKREWVDLIYLNNDHFDPAVTMRIIEMLNNPALTIPSRERSRKTLAQLKALAETIDQLEKNTNFLLHQVLNGGERLADPSVDDSLSSQHQKDCKHHQA